MNEIEIPGSKWATGVRTGLMAKIRPREKQYTTQKVDGEITTLTPSLTL